MLLALINDILDFSKIEAGSMDIVPVDYKIGDMMTEIVNMIWLRAEEKGLAFDVNIDPNVPSVLFGDEIRIKQIIINLLNNAVKYTKDGSVSLHLESQSAGEDQVRLLISVSDTGIGIRQEVIPTLFDAFKRMDQVENRNIEGTGLGLSIVKQLVDLMGGEISVNSVYGQGSTFTVSLVQEVSDPKVLGNISIINQDAARQKFRQMFTAPEACLLIVDDNEMNLEVEKKLLTGTEIAIDTASSGAEALKRTLEKRYDVILMDHLMPEMDGVACLERIRNQTGGLCANTPVIVLTANAGAENREMYHAAGFDGYLVKPVSGKQLEEALIKHLPQEKLILNESPEADAEEMHTARRYTRKTAVSFASGSMCDIPEFVQKLPGISILPWNICTEDGVFRDNIELTADETVRYMNSGRDVRSEPPDESAYIELFSNMLRQSHHVIYLSLSTTVSTDYEKACEAAKSFENVTVINSGCVSSSMGILLLSGYKMAQQGMPIERIVTELERLKKQLHSSYIIGSTDYMVRRKLIGRHVHRIAKALEFRPSVRYRDDKQKVDGLWFGSARRCYAGYIRKELSWTEHPNTDLLFVTYAAIREDDLVWIEEMIRKRINFNHIVFQQGSCGITSNCGPGTLGLFYLDSGERNYNISTLFPRISTRDREEMPAVGPEKAAVAKDAASADETVTEEKWYDGIDGIDGAVAIKNSGSEDAFRIVLKIFYDAIAEKKEELQTLYHAGDWKNYTIRIHALKSSAKLIGAVELSEEARKLEEAGKSEDTVYIQAHHDNTMELFTGYKDALAGVFPEDADAKPEADPALMEEFYGKMRAAAEDMDADAIDRAYEEMGNVRIPEGEAEKYNAVRACYDNFDYDGIAELLND